MKISTDTIGVVTRFSLESGTFLDRIGRRHSPISGRDESEARRR
ncbi:MAG: hypothetical protein NTV33_08450 [Coprothermobacterota bacterium]|nr:hypothetical protein [Coprothermobacterota bacterium]